MSFQDKQLTCRDCGNTFLFTGGEQEFYASKGLQNEPVRCPPCRSARKSNRLTEPEDGYVKYGVFASFGGRTPRQMHPATCADCGMMTEVPFQPRGDRPVYCSSCYNKIKGAAEAEAEAVEKAALEHAATATSDEPAPEAATVDVPEASGADAPEAAEATGDEEAPEAEQPVAVAEAAAEEPPMAGADADEGAEAEEPAAVAEASAEEPAADGEEAAEEEKVESVAEA